LFSFQFSPLSPEMSSVHVRELKAWLEEGRSVRLIDVRGPEEWSLNRLPGAEHIPLAQIPVRYQTLPMDEDLVIYCHHGMRSQRALEFLKGRGYTRAFNLEGGIDAWSCQVDPLVPRY
jgi:adenylyltransferase/sulfurtransferase